MITAVWVTFSRINANAELPGPKGGDPPPPIEKVLHLYAGDSDFTLVWKQASTTIAESKVVKPEGETAGLKYAALAKHLGKQWHEFGQHSDPSDKAVDQCVLHTDDRLPFSEIIATIDAVYATKRNIRLPSGKPVQVPVFNMSFSSR